jgi:tetratricopeptide (TPR) repeat protein
MRGRTLLVILLLVGCSASKNESIEAANQGVEYLNAKSWKKAQTEFERALTLDPSNHTAAYQLGEVFTRQKKWEKAVEPLEKAIKGNPGNARYHFKLGEALFEQEKYDLARAEFESAIKLSKTFYLAYYFLGRVHAKQDHPKDAAEAWTQACLLNPTFGKPFYYLGQLYYDWDRIEQANAVLKVGAENVRDAEDLTDIQYMLGRVYDAQGDYLKAVEAYGAAVQASAENLEGFLMLGMANANLCDKAMADKDKEKAKTYRDAAKKALDEYARRAGHKDTASFNIRAARERMTKLDALKL